MTDLNVFSKSTSFEEKISCAIESTATSDNVDTNRKTVSSVIEKIRNRDQDISAVEIGVVFKSLGKMYAKNYGANNSWFRCRKVDGDAYTNISELIYNADASKIGLGRCNFPHSQILYASINPQTAFSEMNFQPGDLIQWISIKTDRTDFKFHFIGDLHYGYMSGCSRYYNKDFAKKRNESVFSEYGEDALWMLAADGLMGEIFAMRDDDKDARYAYVITSFISELFYNIMPEPALAYPSVKAGGGVNIAIGGEFFDENFYVHQCALMEVSEYIDYHLYLLNGVRAANFTGEARTCHDEGGDIVWEN